MNNRKASKILSWLLLLFFVVGQIIIYAHQHHSKYNALIFHARHSSDKQIVQEKCFFCDQMHHAQIDCVQPLNYCSILNPVTWIYLNKLHHYVGSPLVHADGLSPPALV